MLYLTAAILLVLNTAWLGLVVVGLPGTWLMLAGGVALAWLYPGSISLSVLLVITGLCLLGELGEFLGSLLGAQKSGSTWRGALGAILGSIVGAVLGTALPLPLLGTLLGSCLGAALGAVLFEHHHLGRRGLSQPQHFTQLRHIGAGAAIGRLLGTLAKLGVGVVIWLLLAVAAFWP